MAKIIAVRHGESVANTLGIYQGQTYDTELSELGEKQAKALSKALQGGALKGVKIDRIIASPLKRTLQTAEYVANELKTEVEKERAIIETNHGEWEGKNKDWINKNYPEVLKMWLTNPSQANFPVGEKFSQTVERVENFIFSNDWKGNTLLVTHDNIIRIMVCLAKNADIDRMWEISLDPAGITSFEIKGINVMKRFVLKSLNKTRHLINLKADISVHAL